MAKNKTLPEITVKAVILSLFITVVLAASNAYLGLKIGTTIAASIPAAVVAMSILRFFKNSNILEINMIQTTATAGEALAAAIGYVLPALIILHYWKEFNYWETMAITLIGGLLGVLFSVPLRRVLLNNKHLPFPEGTAIGNVLKASSESKTEMGVLLKGGLISAIISLCQIGFKVLADQAYGWIPIKKVLFGFGIGFSPAVIASGYIVGFGVSLTIFIGSIAGWMIGVPVLTKLFGIPHAATPGAQAMIVWSDYIRYIGVGTMLVGGLWTLFTMLKPIIEGLRTSFERMKHIKDNGAAEIPRTERDIPINYVIWGTILLIIPLFIFLLFAINRQQLGISYGLWIIIALIGTIYVMIAGFICASVSGYITGLVGSTNSPLSGIILSVILFLALILSPLLALQIDLGHAHKMATASAVVIMIAAIVAAIGAISTDNIQDLKAGQMIGATPWRQQLMLIIGVIVSALVIAPVLQLLFNAYGMGGVLPRVGMDATQMLAAPQAGLMAAVAKGVFGHNLPWNMIGTGAVVAVICIIADEFLRRKNIRFPALAVGLGIYLPLDTTTPIFIGGVVALLAKRKLQNLISKNNHDRIHNSRQRGMLLACGLVAGSSLMGVLLAIPFVIKGNANALRLVPTTFEDKAVVLAVIVTLALCNWLYRASSKLR